MSRKLALIIGNSQYQDPRLAQARHATGRRERSGRRPARAGHRRL